MRDVQWGARAVGMAAGLALDAALGDPRRHHPVAWFGTVAGRFERTHYADDRARGVQYVAVLVGGSALVGLAADRVLGRSFASSALLTALGTWAVVGGTSLAREGAAMERLLTGGDLPGARGRLGHLCSRDATLLGEAELARATVESLAENTSDAVVAPVFWGAVAGVPGLLAYRAANTLDAMVGYRDERYLNFGRAAAKFDDALNVIPARLTAGVTVALAPSVGGRCDDALRAWREDSPAHPSPNAGPVEATAAGALGVRLGGVSTYSGTDEDRGTLGNGRAVEAGDIRRAVRLTRRVGLVASAVLIGACALGSLGKETR